MVKLGNMEEDLQSVPEKHPSTYELLILYTAEAHEWAAYLQQILKSSKRFPQKSILLYAVGPEDELHGYSFDSFQNCKCIVVLLSGTFLHELRKPDLRRALQRLLCPPHRVVALLCGVQDDPVLTESFSDWPYWRKLYTEDEPAVYVSTILEAVNENRMRQVKDKRAAHVTAASQSPTSVKTEEETEPAQSKSQEAKKSEEPSEKLETGPTDLSCLTVQPNRVCCGDQETIFIIFKHKIDEYSGLEVEFSSESLETKRIPPTVENSYTLSVAAPDFPAGAVSLTLRTDQSSVSLKPLTYYTNMGEVSRFLDNATDPVNFICQAFKLQSNTTESLDDMLTECLKSKMPATGLQLFGIRQIEEDNMTLCQRNEELPTLLHFAAKYGLKKLTTALLQCPGALQAYSVMNKDGDYPNTLAQRCGFSDLRQFMDEFVETADMLKSHLEVDGDVYERMTASSQDIIMNYSRSEDIYESMLGINPECAEDLYEVMTAVDENPEEAMLRKFFQANPPFSAAPHTDTADFTAEERENSERTEFDLIEEEEDPYNLSADDIYDTVDMGSMYPGIQNRAPAPVPRPEPEPQRDQDKPMAYISRVFSDKNLTELKKEFQDKIYSTARPPSLNQGPVYDPYAGMKTPGQRQLISLQERVKVGEISVEEAVQEFKAWQFDHDRRAHSIRYQQENLKRLRESITRRHKERQKIGQMDYEITAPLQMNMYWGSGASVECAVYDPTPRQSTLSPVSPSTAPPAVVAGQGIKRGSWKTGSTSSTSSTESNRLSTHSTMSYSSGTEPELEDSLECPAPPARPPRPSDPLPLAQPPRVPPRIPERVPEKASHDRYTSCPTRALPLLPQRQSEAAPPVPRRMR